MPHPDFPLFFNFAEESAPQGLQQCCMELLPGPRVADADLYDGVALLEDNFQVVRASLDDLAAKTTIYVTHYVPCKCSVFPPPAGKSSDAHSFQNVWGISNLL